MKIGLLVGREETFPKAFIERIAGLGRADLTAEMCILGGTEMGEKIPYDVIIDRISHEVPYYRTYLKQAVLEGVRVINDPFKNTADDKYFGYCLAAKLGVAIPKTVLLPNKSYCEGIVSESLRNLAYPIDWQGLADHVGFPAFLKPAHGGGWKQVTKVSSMDELWRAYDESGMSTMTLQAAVNFDRYVRCFGIGREEVIVMRYDVDRRRYLPAEGYLEPELEARVIRETLAICRALGYDMNTVEFAIEDGVPYAIDFTNPAPDMEYWSITDLYFDRVVDAMVRLAVRFADAGRIAHPELSLGQMMAAGQVVQAVAKALPQKAEPKAGPAPVVQAAPKAAIAPAVGETPKASEKSAPVAAAAQKPAKSKKGSGQKN